MLDQVEPRTIACHFHTLGSKALVQGPEDVIANRLLG